MNSLDFNVEQLEVRQMMAGDVRVIVNGSNLTIIGTNESDSIAVYSENNQVRVAAGFNSSTTVNGESEFRTGVDLAGKISIRMKGGDDEVILSNLITNERLNINMGSAFSGDLVYFGFGFTNFDLVRVKTGSRTDQVVFDNPIINANMKINTAGGSDEVVFSNTAKIAAGQVSIKTGGGADIIDIRSWTVGTSGSVALNGGGSFDTLEIPADDLFDTSITHRSFEDLVQS